MDLRNTLQTTLGSAYTLGRELGGGGMSRTFVAEERALGRQVVVKVLPPDLAAGVNVDRFKREIQLAARLQHPHIVPVLAAGETDGLPFYTMPFVEGESLRARLSRAGALPITETIGVLRDVAKALAYAHARGIVHRDIKPDNVLLTGGSAVVTDFGIAKALSASKTHAPGGGATLTQVGTSLGTPAYMAPEQAAADPATNHRADIYAFGVLAYELLAGRAPFHGLSPQKLLAAQMGETPEPVEALRPDTPPALADLVMRCLAKDPDTRPQDAADIARVLDTVTSGSANPALSPVLLGGRGMLRRALTFYGAAALATAILAKAAIVGIGLPEWVLPGALVVMALGLPVILFTAYVHHATRRVLVTTPTLTPGGTPVPPSTMATLAMKASPWVSWRRTAMGGAYALGGFAFVVAGFMALRALGIGPAGSLLATGALADRDRVLVADFGASGADSSLGGVVAEAVRATLAQSSIISLAPMSVINAALTRMQRPPTSRLDLPLAREIAAREGIKAIIDGDVTPLGAGYIVRVRLVAAATGDELAAYQEVADTPTELIPAIDKAVRRLRGKMGESLRAVHANPPLEQVTTPSLEALRKYALGSRAIAMEGNLEKGAALLEEAIALDSGFAMAYRRLAAELSNHPGQEARVDELLEQAYRHRHRLTAVERELTTAMYYSDGPMPDENRALAAYDAALAIDPHNTTALNNSGLLLLFRREYARAAERLERALAIDSTGGTYYINLVATLYAQGKKEEAKRVIDRFIENLPSHPMGPLLETALVLSEARYDSTAALVRRQLATGAGGSPARERRFALLATTRLAQGRLAEGRRHQREGFEAAAERGASGARLVGAIEDAYVDAWYLEEPERALRAVDAALARWPLSEVPTTDRPYPELVRFYAAAGRPDRARTMLTEWDRVEGEPATVLEKVRRHTARGHLALAERRYADAIAEYREADRGGCQGCTLPALGYAYDLAGSADSALAVFTRYLSTPDLLPVRNMVDARYRAGVLKRLGELHEERGDRERAASYYAEFLEQWGRADPELQPMVRQVRQRLERLQSLEGR